MSSFYGAFQSRPANFVDIYAYYPGPEEQVPGAPAEPALRAAAPVNNGIHFASSCFVGAGGGAAAASSTATGLKDAAAASRTGTMAAVNGTGLVNGVYLNGHSLPASSAASTSSGSMGNSVNGASATSSHSAASTMNGGYTGSNAFSRSAFEERPTALREEGPGRPTKGAPQSINGAVTAPATATVAAVPAYAAAPASATVVPPAALRCGPIDTGAQRDAAAKPGGPLQWSVLESLARCQAVPVPAESEEQDGRGKLYRQNPLHALQRKARVLLVDSGALRPQAAEPALKVASVLHRRGMLDVEALAAVRQQLLMPAVEALRAAPSSSDGQAADPDPQLSLLRSISSFGAFTDEVLERLELRDSDQGAASGVPAAGRWQEAARAELRRQTLLRQWANWEEPSGPGHLAWLGYDVTVGGSQRVSSAGEVLGRVDGDMLHDEAGLLALPPLSRDASTAADAERKALLVLAARVLQALPDGSQGARLDGRVMLYTPRPPSTASIYAMRQFLQLFPHVQLLVACDDGCPAAEESSAQAPMEVVGSLPAATAAGDVESQSPPPRQADSTHATTARSVSGSLGGADVPLTGAAATRLTGSGSWYARGNAAAAQGGESAWLPTSSWR
eukprot:TRINITY_DN101302_c0_g1_i1.p1 TRINITY_DN101302_c0_g1~~TRINITY_DN101302_c0_g1_i1.p1  ORF type:complete len:620 (-),score=136.87 TRINITY_DN101302_c0_g1_i1:100-1959(-)